MGETMGQTAPNPITQRSQPGLDPTLDRSHEHNMSTPTITHLADEEAQESGPFAVRHSHGRTLKLLTSLRDRFGISGRSSRAMLRFRRTDPFRSRWSGFGGTDRVR